MNIKEIIHKHKSIMNIMNNIIYIYIYIICIIYIYIYSFCVNQEVIRKTKKTQFDTRNMGLEAVYGIFLGFV